MEYTVLERFLRYVKIDTESDPMSTTCPTTMKQKDLAKVLVEELKEMGVKDAELDEWGYVYATIPSNSPKENIPTLCFCSHMDTSPDYSGKNVKPIVHCDYSGEPIKLPYGDIVIDPAIHPDLKDQIGNDVITANGTTLLGADNKAGLAEIMDAAYQWMTDPSLIHGKIRLLFTPDEEVGRGADKVDIKKLNAKYGFTIDGEKLGTLENETFSADSVEIQIKGVNAHPGFAKNKMINAVKIASKIIDSLPQDALSPETTELKEGFYHPHKLEATNASATIRFIIRDFVTANLEVLEKDLKDRAQKVVDAYPGVEMTFTVKEQYRNMKDILDHHPTVIENALEAIERAGVKPILNSIRGGTDGSRLSFMGLPCPNIFAGEHAFHSPYEWVSLQDMQAAVDTIINVAEIFEEKA